MLSWSSCKKKEARLNIPYYNSTFKSNLDLHILVEQKVFGHYFTIKLFKHYLYFLPPSRAIGRGKKNPWQNVCLSPQLSKIISVPNCFEKMSEFPSPGKEISHGKFCQPLCINLITACVPFFDFRLSRNLYKTCSYMLYMLCEPVPITQSAWLKYSIVPYSIYPNASILIDPSRLCAFTSLIIPAAYICTFYSGNGSNLYGE